MLLSNLTTPVAGRVSSGFGDRIHPITGMKSFHNGVDIACPVGTQVVAPENGIITQVYTHKAGGKTLIMQGNSATRYGFCHLSAQIKAVGDEVRQGELICLSGNTGASKGPHVHFTMKRNGQFMDPQDHFNF